MSHSRTITVQFSHLVTIARFPLCFHQDLPEQSYSHKAAASRSGPE